MKRILLALAAVIVLAVALIAIRSHEGAGDITAGTTDLADPAVIARGRYLATLANCAGCHTARGGAEYAGGRGIVTPFGTVYASNLTPDRDTGIGAWSESDFWRALHFGRSKDGRLLTPAFPYVNYTQVTRADAAAIFAWLRTLPPVRQTARAHELPFPFDQSWLLSVWRALYFRPGEFAPAPDRDATWNRGAYLVRALAHCDACHAPRNALGAVAAGDELRGGFLPGRKWYAPSLRDAREAGLAAWSEDAIVALLGTGITAGASVAGPMADVVYRSTRHATDADLRAMAAYLRALPQDAEPRPDATTVAREDPQFVLGRELYGRHCADCHGEQGEGAPGAYPALAGNRAVTMRESANVLRMILGGGFPPSTDGNPRPYGMPPFAHALDDAAVAALATYIRNAWGNRAARVEPIEVNHRRGAFVD